MDFWILKLIFCDVILVIDWIKIEKYSEIRNILLSSPIVATYLTAFFIKYVKMPAKFSSESFLGGNFRNSHNLIGLSTKKDNWFKPLNFQHQSVVFKISG